MDFKEKGKDALACAVKGMHLTQGLQKSPIVSAYGDAVDGSED